MVEVINIDTNKKIIICKHCGKVLAYTDEDKVFIDSKEAIVCPECKNVCRLVDNIQPNLWPNNYRDLIPDPLTVWYGTQTTKHSCEDCDWHKQMSNQKTPYVGDSPCDWCSKKQITVSSNIGK